MDHWKELAIAILSVLLQSSSTINTCLFDVPLMGSYCRLLVRMDLTESRLDVCLEIDSFCREYASIPIAADVLHVLEEGMGVS